ncbi:hypothetical protein Bca4012_018747 [Brassica carinata]
MVTKSQAGIRKLNPNYVLFIHRTAYPEPKSVVAVIKEKRWTNAMGIEMGYCKETETWSLVPRTPEIHVLGSRWIYRTKLNANVTLNKLKARMVAQGND